MLKSLTVWNFALLEHVQVEFQSGLNILTGETGAGKSILIDSLGAVLGARMSADMVRVWWNGCILDPCCMMVANLCEDILVCQMSLLPQKCIPTFRVASPISTSEQQLSKVV